VAESSAVVNQRVRRTLARSAEFRALSAERQTRLVDDMARAGGDAAHAMAARGLVDAVDFPSFVAGLIKGTFEAIVDASVRQMEAYTELLRHVAKSVDEFMRDNVVDGGEDKSARRRLATQRQQTLATMVLMGITGSSSPTAVSPRKWSSSSPPQRSGRSKARCSQRPRRSRCSL
jgi:hypothetical protein